MNNTILVNNIKKICKDNNVSISALEQDLNLSPGLISRWIKNMPSLDKIIEIANYFNVSLDNLVGNANNEKNDDVSITRLLITLYNKSIEAEIEWKVYDPDDSKNIINIKLSSIINKKNTDCFYCCIDDGNFILIIQHINGEEEVSLYVLPDQYSFPELIKCSNNEKLYNLYKYVLRRLSKQLNKIKTNNFINTFINEKKSTSIKNITVLQNAVNE